MAVDAPLPDDVETLKAMLLAEREAYRAELREQALRIEQLKQRIAKLQHERFGQSSERRALLEQLELQRARGRPGPGRDAAGDRRTAERGSTALYAPQAGPPAVARSPAARACRLSSAAR